MDYIHHNSSMVWSPFNTILAPLQLKAVSCSKGICGPFNLLSVYKAQVWRSDADKWKTQRIVCRVCTTCWLNRITQKHCLMLVLWEGILVHMPTNRLHNLFHICSLFPLSLGKTCLWENEESQVLDFIISDADDVIQILIHETFPGVTCLISKHLLDYRIFWLQNHLACNTMFPRANAQHI